MKRNTNKKTMSLTMAFLMMGGMAFADTYKDQERQIDGVSYLPVRSVMESYGYEVIYNAELKTIELLRGAGYDAYYLNSNSYVRNKMAPMPLEHKIIVENGKTYISSQDLVDNMRLEEEEKDPVIENVKVTGLVIDSIEEDGRIKCLQGQGQAYVYVDQAQVSHYGQEGDYKITKKDIGKEILVTSPPYMTAIYPAQYRAIAVEVLAKNVSASVGKVAESDFELEDAVLITENGGVDVLVLVNEDTAIENAKGEKLTLSGIKEGSKITAYHSIAMTMSIPGQTLGYKLIVEQ